MKKYLYVFSPFWPAFLSVVSMHLVHLMMYYTTVEP